jgi:hypothetical protein
MLFEDKEAQNRGDGSRLLKSTERTKRRVAAGAGTAER